VRPDKINDILEEKNTPISIKAVMMKNINVQINKLQLLHLFTTKKLFDLFDSTGKGGNTPVIVNLDELLIIVGPSHKYMNNH
jgi:hypothetical protein